MKGDYNFSSVTILVEKLQIFWLKGRSFKIVKTDSLPMIFYLTSADQQKCVAVLPK